MLILRHIYAGFYLNIFRFFYFAAIVAIMLLAVLPDYDNLPELFSISDKLNHIAAFFVLALLAHLSRFRSGIKKQHIFLLIYAFLIEIIQYFLPTREFSFLDIAADVIGLLLSIFAASLMRKKGESFV